LTERIFNPLSVFGFVTQFVFWFIVLIVALASQYLLNDAFVAFGEVSEAKVIRDPATLKSKGYGFVSFPKKEEADRAIEQMNGAWLGRRAIRTNWATRRGVSATGAVIGHKTLQFDEMYNQTGPTNTTVYVGNIGQAMTEDDLREAFCKFGGVVEVRIFKQQGYAFIRFESKDQACQAICNMNNVDVAGQSVRCSWGRAADSSQTQAGQSYGYGYGGGANAFTAQSGAGGYVNPQQAALAQQQAQQYWNQYYQYYSNPTVMQQWQAYWQQTGAGGAQ